jgi:hypothetical protein
MPCFACERTKMNLEIHNVFTKVQATDEEKAWLREYLSFDDDSTKFRGGSYHPPLKMRLFSLVEEHFPTGLLPLVRRAAPQEGFTVTETDARLPPCLPDENADLGWLRTSYQLPAVQWAGKMRRGLIKVPTGGGKCLGKGTPVLLFDGAVKPVEEVREGDLLMGPDSRPRAVRSVTTGSGPLFLISPQRGAEWVCNDAHVLTLVHTETGEVVDVPLSDYLLRSEWWRHCHKQFSVGVEFPAQVLPVDPYFYGVWLGGGRKDLDQGVQVSKPAPEIRQVCADVATAWGLQLRVDEYKSCPMYRLVAERGQPNPLLTAMRGLWPEIPRAYLTGTREQRAELLAGLLDTDGYLHKRGFEIIQKRQQIAEAACFLARSLGLRAYSRTKEVPGYGMYFRIGISGDCSFLPLRIPRKQAAARQQKKCATRTRFSVLPLGAGDYFGFTLDGDGRFLLGDFTVTHNTEIAVGLTRYLPCPWLFLVHRGPLLEQTAARYELRTGFTAGRIGEGKWEEADFTVATFQTLYARLKAEGKHGGPATNLLKRVGGLICDEAHTLPADTFWQVAMACEAYYRVGLSATPMPAGHKGAVKTIAATAQVMFKVDQKVLEEEGVLAKAKIWMVPVYQESARPTYQGVYGELVVRGAPRNRVIIEACKRAEKPCLLFVKEIKHGKLLLEALKKAGVSVGLVDGAASSDRRRSQVERLVRAEIDVLITTVIFQEGVDIPELRSVVIACGGASAVAALQRIGRGMRVTKDKTTFEVWDIEDRGNKWLEKHGKLRRRHYESEGHKVVTAKP